MNIQTDIVVRGRDRPTPLYSMQIPDLWHVAMRQESETDKKLILEVWHIAHDLLGHAKSIDAGIRVDSSGVNHSA